MTATQLTSNGIEKSGDTPAGIAQMQQAARKPGRLKSLLWLVVSFAAGAAFAAWVFHKVQFEQQADGVMTAVYAENLGLIEKEDSRLGQIGPVWFARSAAGGYLYRAVYQGTDKRSGVISRTTRIDLIRICKAAQQNGCRMLDRN